MEMRVGGQERRKSSARAIREIWRAYGGSRSGKSQRNESCKQEVAMDTVISLLISADCNTPLFVHGSSQQGSGSQVQPQVFPMGEDSLPAQILGKTQPHQILEDNYRINGCFWRWPAQSSIMPCCNFLRNCILVSFFLMRPSAINLSALINVRKARQDSHAYVFWVCSVEVSLFFPQHEPYEH